MRSVLGANGTPIQPFDQDAWASVFQYGKRDPTLSLEVFRVLRENNLAMLKALPPTAWDNYGMHAERGKETIAHLARLFAGHDTNHAASGEHRRTIQETAGLDKDNKGKKVKKEVAAARARIPQITSSWRRSGRRNRSTGCAPCAKCSLPLPCATICSTTCCRSTSIACGGGVRPARSERFLVGRTPAFSISAAAPVTWLPALRRQAGKSQTQILGADFSHAMLQRATAKSAARKNGSSALDRSRCTEPAVSGPALRSRNFGLRFRRNFADYDAGLREIVRATSPSQR